MRKSLVLAAAGAAICAAMVGPATASADPASSNSETALDTISGLQAQGYTVHIDRVGSASLQNCRVTNVRNPNENWDYYRDNDGDRHRYLVSKTIQVSLAC